MATIRTQLPMFSAIQWLSEGFSDMRATQFKGTYYGLVFTLVAFVISFIYATYWKATMGLTASFFLMGPIICTGIYDLSRQQQQDGKASLIKSTTAWFRNWKSIGFFAVILTFLMIIWVRVSIVLFALFASHEYPDMQSLIGQIVSLKNIEFLLVWLCVGSVFASLAFALSVVSVPMLLDRPCDTLEAIFTSANALWNNTLTCFVWALCIVLLVGSALIFFKPLLIVVAPWVGHATWRAYQALVDTQATDMNEESMLENTPPTAQQA
ncbi:MAG: hypothetical protein RIR68_197 [Pseudomonadota bacterium]|jgi:uncharacterized membrane protein